MSGLLFLTSSPDSSYQKEDGSWVTGPLSGKNGFLARVRAAWPGETNVLAVASDPENDAMNVEMHGYYERLLAASGLPVRTVFMLDGRTKERLDEWLPQCGFVILSGGHVPTQNRFFAGLGLRERLSGYEGLIMGISAGTMNCADVVYAQPELPGESVDPAYERYLPGLGLTKLNILPHYQTVKDNLLDGRRLMEDITYADSLGHRFIAMADGTYVVSDGRTETLCGLAYEIRDGRLRRICGENEELRL